MPVEELSVDSVNPVEGRQLELFTGFPSLGMCWFSNGFCFAVPDYGLNQRMLITVANTANRGNSFDLGKRSAMANGGEFTGFNLSLQNRPVGSTGVVWGVGASDM